MTKPEPKPRYAIRHPDEIKYISGFSTATGFPHYTKDFEKARTYIKETADEIISRYPLHRKVPG